MDNQNFNQFLISVLTQIKQISITHGATSFETLILDLFLNSNILKHVSSKEFKENYSEYKMLSHRNHKESLSMFDLSEVTLSSGIKRDDNLIVSQPNGSQSSPDFLIIHNKKALPIEIKSSKQDSILWNSGWPRKDYIYIFNNYSSHKQTTFFLGQSIMSEFELNNLLEISKVNKQTSNLFNHLLTSNKSKWSVYARPMFNYSGKYLSNSDLIQERESQVFTFIKELQW